ncbi:MAG: nucleotidyltransferase domain-containing protein [Lachnospiraceae bacterium]|nr:nucleotidyltransferase domain-containing protein [Lachnospiraceae bacterium]
MCSVIEMEIDNRKIRVADIKKKYIENIIDAARKCDIIDRIMLFGSSTGSRCKKSSDIDLAIFGKETEYKALRSKKYSQFTDQLYDFDNDGQGYDLLYFKSGKEYQGRIMDDILNGEQIYVRE